ncbi:helix-turn-helix domain-containing protein [Terribacillus saccharophilus]|uniref:helix-turn-helix domain-containing protein n=1 Tax=Terribacillus saccharophilus TaxID=361277 RepID=UPI000C9CE91B|nr:helix-turn-helix transcriptional regulator [Terribacillus goriensis]
MSDLNIYLGQILRKYRNERGLNQEELAFQSDLDRTYISLLERGKRNPTIKTLFILCSVLDISPELIIKELQTKVLERDF